MSDQDLAEVNGQAGLTINGDLVMKGMPGDGTAEDPSDPVLCPEDNCFDMSLKNPGDDKFLVLDDARIEASISNLTLDADGAYTSTFAGDGVTAAVVMGLPDRLEFRDSQIGAITVAWNETASETGDTALAPASYQLRVGQNENFGQFQAGTALGCGFLGLGSCPPEDLPGFWTTVVSAPGPSNGITSLGLSQVSGLNAAYTQNNPTQGTWTWDTDDPPANPGDIDDDYPHTAAGTFFNSIMSVTNQGTVTVDVSTSGGGDNDAPNPFITIIDRNTGNVVASADGGDDNDETLSTTLGNPVAQIGNRDLLSINLDGGFSMNGNVVLIPQ
ncbi:hypothetical protein GP5015_2072 [gamma proteobacterium HTCC5015]|nr:hypothetical protein GP5015_2072 [gamma proteobacterium HTCC5015]